MYFSLPGRLKMVRRGNYFVKCLLLVSSLVLGIQSALANESRSDTEVSFDFGYSVFLFGEMRDYFANNFNYAVHTSHGFLDNDLGPMRYTFGLQYAPIVSDDVRESSRLTILTLYPGLEQRFLSISWFELWLQTSLDFVAWRLRNFLSENFPSSDQGFYVGAQLGVRFSFHLGELWKLGIFVTTRVPEFKILNTFFDTGISIGREI